MNTLTTTPIFTVTDEGRCFTVKVEGVSDAKFAMNFKTLVWVCLPKNNAATWNKLTAAMGVDADNSAQVLTMLNVALAEQF